MRPDSGAASRWRDDPTSGTGEGGKAGKIPTSIETGADENALAVTGLPASITMEALLLQTAVPAVRPMSFKKEVQDTVGDQSFKSVNGSLGSEGRCKTHNAELRALVHKRQPQIPAIHFQPLPLVTVDNDDSDDDTVEMDTVDKSSGDVAFSNWEMRF